MSWSDVGNWVKENAGTGTALVGSLLTGNVPSAVAAGIALVSSATGATSASEALTNLQTNPETVLRLKELYYENEKSVRSHLENMTRLQLEDKQHEHEQTQLTIRNGDSQESKIRWVRPGHATVSLAAAIAYVFIAEAPDAFILGTLLTLPFTYMGVRQIDKTKASNITALKK